MFSFFEKEKKMRVEADGVKGIRSMLVFSVDGGFGAVCGLCSDSVVVMM